MTRTRSQVRAANALKWKDRIVRGKAGGDIVRGFPMLMRTNGLLATGALAVEKDSKTGMRKNSGEFDVFSAIAEHLASEGVGVTKATGPDALVAELVKGDASLLRRATAEALAFLNYLKRFAA